MKDTLQRLGWVGALGAPALMLRSHLHGGFEGGQVGVVG